MSKFFVTWEIDVDDVDTPKEAAEEAFKTMQKTGTGTTCFEVMDKETEAKHFIDLSNQANNYCLDPGTSEECECDVLGGSPCDACENMGPGTGG